MHVYGISEGLRRAALREFPGETGVLIGSSPTESHRTAGSGSHRSTHRNAATTASVAVRLSDAPRCGAPATFTPEVICKIVALSCEDPEALDVPISHWSQSELARQAVRRGIVESISHGSVGRFLKRSGP